MCPRKRLIDRVRRRRREYKLVILCRSITPKRLVMDACAVLFHRLNPQRMRKYTMTASDTMMQLKLRRRREDERTRSVKL